ncbi:malto-oligosyltrehalose trehalohydrolase [Pontibacter flavimaris]|uniref:Malto-oligosyltrehalose trehalohydrolase n=1 Tax=Pontibacter flavimaris TaxID=1797110 RepID=A0A1Q5PHJ8_9BACT|nr:malto-oligosyltrehalose trehalohydrolase [Pontibacter flavimaris]OKL41704.1 malto-oligosyltrehalose trehalohydrolase [Pontibacter flavimaris]
METAGALYLGHGRCRFHVWAPEKQHMMLHLVHPRERTIRMQQDAWGYFTAEVEDVAHGTRYYFNSDNEGDFPDPASFSQPEGVHGPSEVVDHTSFTWTDAHWKNLPLQEMVLYELHVGTFTPEGTFEAIIPRLEELRETGINALELMPVAQFPGGRNWGYDGVFPFAVQHSYGGPEGLKKLVDACHAKGIAVLLDVVYNHLGPEGNYLGKFGPYFTGKYKTPWGAAINFDGAYSDGVRAFFSENPVYWLRHFHIDGLRLDAIHTMFDQSATSFWELMSHKIAQATQESGRPFHLVGESDLNSPRVVQPAETGGYGFNAQWLDDFHHALYVLLDKKGQSLYEDFGQMAQLVKAYTDGFVHSGEYVKFRKKTFGASSAHLPGDTFIAFTQNHDQVGNRVHGERMSVLVNFERLKLSAAALLLSPYIPMLFMGEEYGEDNPFLYFVSHSDKKLIKAVQEGRKREFAGFKWEGEPPNPQDAHTFESSKLQWQKREKSKHNLLLKWYQHLISMRKEMPALRNIDKERVQAAALGEQGFILLRQSMDREQQLLCLFNLSEQELKYEWPTPEPKYKLVLHSKDEQWMQQKEGAKEMPDQIATGTSIKLPPLSVVVYASVEM